MLCLVSAGQSERRAQTRKGLGRAVTNPRADHVCRFGHLSVNTTFQLREAYPTIEVAYVPVEARDAWLFRSAETLRNRSLEREHEP